MELEKFKNFFIEFIEACCILLIIQAILDKPINPLFIIKSAFIISSIIYISNSLLGDSFKSDIKQGFRQSCSYFIFASLGGK